MLHAYLLRCVLIQTYIQIYIHLYSDLVIVSHTHFLQETDFYNPEHRTRWLKEKLQAHYGERLAFHFEQHDKDEIVYSDSISTTEAFAKFHNSSSTEKVKVEQAAMILRKTIKQAFKKNLFHGHLLSFHHLVQYDR